MTCLREYLNDNGEGVAEAIGNWGLSNRTCNNGQELGRLKCLFAKMDRLRTTKPMTYVQYNRKNDPEAWHVKPSPEGCKPAWTFPGRTYMLQGTTKWYRRGPDCCPQPSCLPPQCKQICYI